MASLVLLGFLGIFALVGLVMVGIGAMRLRKWRIMKKLDPTGAMAVEEGLQEFEGRAHAVEETKTAPFTGEESVICSHEVERYRANDDGSNWKTVDEKTRTAPFEIEGSGNAVAVDPSDAQHLLTEEFQVDTGRTDAVPDRVRAYVDQRMDRSLEGSSIELGPIELGGGPRLRFTEERLDDGEEVYVLGNVTRDPSKVPPGSGARMAVNPEQYGWQDKLFGDPFVISDTGEEEATSRQLKSALIVLGFGLLFTAFPAAFGYLALTGG